MHCFVECTLPLPPAGLHCRNHVVWAQRSSCVSQQGACRRLDGQRRGVTSCAMHVRVSTGVCPHKQGPRMQFFAGSCTIAAAPPVHRSVSIPCSSTEKVRMPNLAGFSALPPAPSPLGPWSTPQRPASMHGHASPPLPAPASLPPRPGSVRLFPQRVHLAGLAPRQPAPRPCYPPVFALKDYVRAHPAAGPCANPSHSLTSASQVLAHSSTLWRAFHRANHTGCCHDIIRLADPCTHAWPMHAMHACRSLTTATCSTRP